MVGIPRSEKKRFFDGEHGEDVIDVAAHFSNPPTSPRPELRRAVIVDRNLILLGAPGDVPIEPREIDEHDRIHRTTAKDLLGLVGEPKKVAQFGEHLDKPDHGMAGQIEIEPAAGGGHLGAAETAGLQIRCAFPQRLNQTRRMLIPTRLADGEEDCFRHRLQR